MTSFIWQYLDRTYAISFLACDDRHVAERLTIEAFERAFADAAHGSWKQLPNTLWEWLSQHVVDSCASFHTSANASPQRIPTEGQLASPSQVDWERTVILGTQRVKKCLAGLPVGQRKAFILRHQLDLGHDQIAKVLNQQVDTVMVWLFRARVGLVMCLGQ